MSELQMTKKNKKIYIYFKSM